MVCGQLDDLDMPARKKGTRADEEGIGRVARKVPAVPKSILVGAALPGLDTIAPEDRPAPP
jgi:hypothetical protein